MTGVRVKICGLTRREDVHAAIDYGADALGFVFGYSDSPRNLGFGELKRLIDDVPPYVNTVVVSHNSNPDLARVVREIKPTLLQLSGAKVPIRANVKLGPSGANIVQTVHPSVGEENDILQTCQEFSKICKGILLDSASIAKGNTSVILGGSGAVHDWRLSRKIRNMLYPFPVILAGGLNDGNVQDAIRIVMPYAVDVSSGVEKRPGIKDEEKVRHFIENAKRVD
jgi:phosphoribosylanthranilate isomerase